MALKFTTSRLVLFMKLTYSFAHSWSEEDIADTSEIIGQWVCFRFFFSGVEEHAPAGLIDFSMYLQLQN